MRGLLPADHDGAIAPAPAAPLPALGGYQRTLLIAGGAWLALLPLLLWRRRRARAAAAPRPPTLAELLAPLVVQAQGGGLDADGRARLERLLIAHWRERLDLAGLDLHAALARLRADAAAGALLRQVEAWLHARPGSGAAVDVPGLLAPYRALTARGSGAGP